MDAQTPLAGQRAIVTGANSGIGRAVALALGHAGADVVVNYVSRPRRRQKVVADIEKASGGRAFGFRADVSQEAEVQAMFARAVETFGAVDIVVNNAGLQKDAPFEELSVAAWDLVMNVNLKGQFLCAREAVRDVQAAGHPHGVSCAAGKILCVSSVHDIIPWAGHVNYAASKGGVMMMMKSIAQEVAPLAHPRQQHLARRRAHAHQRRGLEHARGLQRAHDAGAVQAHRRARRHRPRRRVARVRRLGLRHGRDDLRRRRHDSLSRVPLRGASRPLDDETVGAYLDWQNLRRRPMALQELVIRENGSRQ